ncbi:MAG: hypothetical protein HZB51_07100 [Chloroflexi bacterium]|nr:hypothetical protein [Chloroflexota bacterium]
MLYLKCDAACGNFDLCLIACPHNVQLDKISVPVCDCQREGLIADEDEEWVVVVEEGKNDR